MNPQYTPDRVSSYILGKDEDTCSSPVISSRNQSVTADFCGFGAGLEWARRPAFLLTSWMKPAIYLYHLSVRVRERRLKTLCRRRLQALPKLVLCQLPSHMHSGRKGCVRAFPPAFRRMLQRHLRRAWVETRLCTRGKRGAQCRSLCGEDKFGGLRVGCVAER